MFGAEAIRLLREDWPNATMLAQELYAIFQDSVPASTNAPLTANSSNPDQAPLVVNQFGNGGLSISFNKGQGGGIQINDGVPQLVDKNGNPVGGSGGGVPGKVLSGSGSGPYQVQIYPAGLSGTTKTVSVTQLQIDSSDSVPANTWTIVNQVGSNYYMQVPVWLE